MKKKSYVIFALCYILVLQSKAQNPTWTDGIACIVYSHCTSCHNASGIAPFSLTTYNDAYDNRYSIAAAVQALEMPPFPPNQDRRKYAHANTLTVDEIQEIADWVNNSAPLGDSNNIPSPPTYNAGYQLSNPDVIVQIPTYTVNTTIDLYRVFALPVNNSSDEFIQSIEIVPGNRDIVHHALVFQDTSVTPFNLDNADPLPGYSAFGGTGSSSSKLVWVYTPGQGVYNYPNGFGAKLLANSYICIQIHYPGGISNQQDSTHIRIKYGSSSLRNVATLAALNHMTSLTNGPLFIPADSMKTFYSQINVGFNYTALGLMPHMHLAGQSIKSYCVKPNGDTIHLLDLPNWDFHWQGFYQFQKPVLLPAGSVLYGEATYDNTVNNPHNPNSPPQDISLGEATTDEMMMIYFNLTGYQAGDTSIIVDTASHFEHHTACLSTGVNSSASFNDFKLFPNPAKNTFTISGIDESYNLVLFNSEGKKLYIKNDCFGQATLTDLKLAHGVYYLQISTRNNLITYKKVVIE